MSSRNDESSAMATGVGIIGTAAVFMALFMFAVFAFFAFVLTILCVFAWNNPVTLGTWTIEPGEARAFVLRGIAGMSLVPLFFAFCDVVFGPAIVWAYLPHMMGVGYVGGSVGIEYLKAKSNQEQPQTEIIPPPSQLPTRTQGGTPSQESQAEPFRFATWDDEENGR